MTVDPTRRKNEDAMDRSKITNAIPNTRKTTDTAPDHQIPTRTTPNHPVTLRPVKPRPCRPTWDKRSKRLTGHILGKKISRRASKPSLTTYGYLRYLPTPNPWTSHPSRHIPERHRNRFQHWQ